jgi:hypothetical protein
MCGHIEAKTRMNDNRPINTTHQNLLNDRTVRNI